MRTLYRIFPLLAYALVAAAFWPVTASGQIVLDLTTEGAVADHNGARFIQEDASEGAGTGILDPFVRTKNDVGGVTASMNTGNSTVQFQTESGPWTESLLLSTVTDRDLGEFGIFKEFALDINQTAGNSIYGMTEVQLWADDQSDLNCYNPAAGGSWGTCDTGDAATRVYWLDQNTGGSFPGSTGDATVLMDYGLESGSGGQTDIVMLISIDLFPDAENCYYGSLTCSTYLYLYSRFGDDLVNGSPADDGFEEWSTLVEPFVHIDKTLAGSIDETHDWNLTKDVDSLECDQFVGGTCTFNYTVEVTEIEDFSLTIGGQAIYSVPITLPDGDQAAPDANVTVDSDVYSDIDGTVVWADPTCAIGSTFTLAAGESKLCVYSVDYADAGDADSGLQSNTLTASVEFNEGVFIGYAEATIATNSNGPSAVDVTDTIEGLLGSGLTDGATFNYPQIQECSADPGDYTDGAYSFDVTNIAEIVQTDDEDTVTVTVNCFAPVVSKTADAEYTQHYSWTIDKSVDPAEHHLFAGGSADSDYDVLVDLTYSEDDFAISGTINVINPNPSVAMNVAVADVLDDGTAVVLGCLGALEVPAGGNADCGYTATPTDASATLNTATVTLNSVDFDATAAVSFDVTVDGFPTINVTDTVEGALGSASADHTFEYTNSFECSDDPADYEGDGYYTYQVPNIASIDETGASDNALVTVLCYAPVVSKTAEPAVTRTYIWDIDKSADPATWNLFDGESGTTEYSVQVTLVEIQETGFGVVGVITVQNPAPMEMTVAISDVVPGLQGDVTIVCDDGDAGSDLTIAAEGSGTCAYNALTDGTNGTNTATATLNEIGFSGSASVDFAEAEVTEINPTVDVTDTNGAAWNDVADDATFNYERTFECGADEGTHDNTATITQTGQSDDASVTVNCYDITVTKDADGTYTREYDWDITKRAVDPEGGDLASLLLDIGQTYSIPYEVVVSVSGFVDSDFHVSGQITVSNPSPIQAVINGLSDLVSPDVAASVDCAPAVFPHMIEAGGSLVCSYDADLLDAEDRLNEATAVLQLHDYASDGSAELDGTRDVSGTADVAFADPTTILDECTDVSDTLGGDLGQVCLADSPKTFEYTYDVIPTAEQCGEFTVDNTASHVEIDTEDTDSAIWSILVTVQCPEGCTLTQGYWKTHNESFHGGAPADETWFNIGDMDGDGISEGENEDFFLSGDTWFEVFWTAPKGNAYYNLAHQWMAAYLNTMNDAYAPDEVVDALADAQAWFEANAPSASAAKGKNKDKELHSMLVGWAGTLGSYNEGEIGPGHCDEDGSSEQSPSGLVNVAGSVEAAVTLNGVAETPSEEKGSADVKSVEVDNVLADEVSRIDAASAAVEIPGEFQVGNYPNPFNPTTTIQVALPEASHVRVAVYDLLGRMVTLLLDGQLSAGTHSVTFDAGSLPSGVYLYRFEHAGGAITKTMQLLK